MESHRKLIDGSRKEWIETSQNSGSGGRSLLVPQGMSKIRINELARELEVKPSIIIELLPELGVHDKKTHSSSLDDDLALIVRRHVAGGGGGPKFEADSEAKAAERAPESFAVAPAEVAEPVFHDPTPQAPTPAAPTGITPTVAAVEAPPPVRQVAPLRPPLASVQSGGQHIVQPPVQPPFQPAFQAPVQPAVPSPAQPVAQATPHAPAPSQPIGPSITQPVAHVSAPPSHVPPAHVSV